MLCRCGGCAGKLGHNSEENITAPCVIPTLESLQVVQISAGCEHSGAITAAGELFTWGHGDGGRLGHGDSEPRIVPTRVEALLQMHARPLTLHCGDKFTMIAVEPLPAENTDLVACKSTTSAAVPSRDIEQEPKQEQKQVFSLEWLHTLVDKHVLSLASLEESAGEKAVFTGDMTMMELKKLSEAYAKKEVASGQDHSSNSKAAGHEEATVDVEEAPLPTGRDILLGVLSLMARSFTDQTLADKKKILQKKKTAEIDLNQQSSDDNKPCLAYEYSVEISVQLFQSLLMILTLQSEELFEVDDIEMDDYDEQDMQQNEPGSEIEIVETRLETAGGEENIMEEKEQQPQQQPSQPQTVPCLQVDEVWAESGVFHSSDDASGGDDSEALPPGRLPKSLMTWATLRCALSILRSNLHVLNDVCAADQKKEIAIKGLLSRHMNRADSKLFDINNNLNDVLSPTGEDAPKGSLSASGRLASLLGASLTSNLDEYDGLRSSDDDDDEDEDDDDDEDDEDDDDVEEEEEDSDDEDDDEEEDEDCDEDEEMTMGDMLEHLHEDGYEDDDMDISKDLLDEEAAKLARAVISMMDSGEEEQEHDEHDHSYDDEYDLGKDLYDNEEEMDLNLEEEMEKEEGTARGNRGHDDDEGEQEQEEEEVGKSHDHGHDEGRDLTQQQEEQGQEEESGGGNNDSEDNDDAGLDMAQITDTVSDTDNRTEAQEQEQEQEQKQERLPTVTSSSASLSDTSDSNADSGQSHTMGNMLSPAASQESLNMSRQVSNESSEDGSENLNVGGVRVTEEEKTNEVDDQKAQLDEDLSQHLEHGKCIRVSAALFFFG